MLPVDGPGQLVNSELGQIGQHRQGAGHIPIKGAVSHGQFRAVAGGQKEAPFPVGDKHEDISPDAGLEILLGQVHLRPAGAVKLFQVSVKEGSDRDGPRIQAQVLRQGAGIFQAVRR